MKSLKMPLSWKMPSKLDWKHKTRNLS